MLARTQALIAGAGVVTALAITLAVMARRPAPAVAVAPAPVIVADARAVIVPSLGLAPDAPSAARAEREQLLAKVVENHAGTEPWDAQGLAILQAIAVGPVTDLDCYMAGCIATFTFPSLAAYHAAVARAEASPAYAAWTGGKQYTTPDALGDGQVIVTLLLNRPD